MITDTARILVIGAGVNGSICAVGLHNAGANVTVLARGRRHEELCDNGIVIENPFNNARSVTKVPVIDRLDPQDVYDYILVIVRKNQVAELLPVLADNRSPNIVFMVNNPSGPEEFIRTLGRERVMLGFVFGAGKRDGSVIYGISESASSMAGRLWTSPFGEVDGTITLRLKRLVGILRRADLPAGTSRNVTDYLATHAALVAPLGGFVMQRGYDHAALRRYTNEDFGLLVDAMRQTLDVLGEVGVRITPAGTVILKVVPRFVWVALLRAVLPSKFMEVGGMYHVSQAPDEIRQLGVEMMRLVEKSGLSVPALRSCLGNPGNNPQMSQVTQN